MGNRLSSAAKETHVAEILQSLRTEAFSDYKSRYFLNDPRKLLIWCRLIIGDKRTVHSGQQMQLDTDEM